MAKYSKVIDALPRYLGSDPSFQDKVNAIKAKIIHDDPLKARSASQLAIEYRRLRENKEQFDKMEAELNQELAAISQLLIEQYEVEGVSSQRLSTGESVSVIPEPYAVIENMEKLHQWAIENGLENSFKLTVSWSRINSIVKERLLAGLPEPDGVTAHAKMTVRLNHPRKVGEPE